MSTTHLVWKKSSYSGSGGDDCVEVAAQADAVRVRDSTRVEGAVLAVSPRAWEEFVAYAGEGRG